MKTTFLGSAVAIALGLAAISAPAAMAEPGYPNKPIQLVVPYAPGGVNDVLARLIGKELAGALKQPVVIDNKAGGTGIVGSEFVKKSAPDGYTLLQGATGPSVANAVLYKSLPYDPVKDFQPVALVGTTPFIIYVNAKIPANTLQELIALSKAKPGTLNYGVGASVHQLAMEMLKSRTGADFTYVPYRGGTPALSDIIGGHTQIGLDGVTTPLSAIQDGSLRGLAVTSSVRSVIVPNTPTVAETGVPDYDIGGWSGIFAPAGTPMDIVQKLNSEIIRIVQQPAIREKLIQLGVEPSDATPTQFQARQVRDIAAFAKAAKDANVPKLD